ncbi:hypothetical protein ACOMHN_028431 [Nucella lapillus]
MGLGPVWTHFLGMKMHALSAPCAIWQPGAWDCSVHYRHRVPFGSLERGIAPCIIGTVCHLAAWSVGLLRALSAPCAIWQPGAWDCSVHYRHRVPFGSLERGIAPCIIGTVCHLAAWSVGLLRALSAPCAIWQPGAWDCSVHYRHRVPFGSLERGIAPHRTLPMGLE